jgi:phage shock protein A
MTSSTAAATTDRPETAHEALIEVDRMIGLRAEAATARAALAPVQRELAKANHRIAELESRLSQLEQPAAEADALRRELDDIKESEAWRIGRTATRFLGRLRPAGRAS